MEVVDGKMGKPVFCVREIVSLSDYYNSSRVAVLLSAPFAIFMEQRGGAYVDQIIQRTIR